MAGNHKRKKVMIFEEMVNRKWRWVATKQRISIQFSPSWNQRPCRVADWLRAPIQRSFVPHTDVHCTFCSHYTWDGRQGFTTIPVRGPHWHSPLTSTQHQHPNRCQQHLISQSVTRPNTLQAKCCSTSVLEGAVVFPTWLGCWEPIKSKFKGFKSGNAHNSRDNWAPEFDSKKKSVLF